MLEDESLVFVDNRYFVEWHRRVEGNFPSVHSCFVGYEGSEYHCFLLPLRLVTVLSFTSWESFSNFRLIVTSETFLILFDLAFVAGILLHDVEYLQLVLWEFEANED